MTMIDERTRSIVDAVEFLRDISDDQSIPEAVRLRAKRLLRHYPAPREIWLAGKLEARRQDELALLADKYGPLHPVLALWLTSEPMFCDKSPKKA
ncbi:MAG: hypothetical protein CVV07_13310 [Gammaproteobacteria bacterium HGW-Gammaproteobacteria-11]|nr:MAG: hypothetical protein CVV07_13310 [Gammaproteobacteria bacterium HGW-Gammaproteobacteria-11]